MTNQEFVEAHIAAAKAIMADKSLAGTGKSGERADHLEVAMRHLVCAAIINGEVSMSEVARLLMMPTIATPPPISAPPEVPFQWNGEVPLTPEWILRLGRSPA